MTDPPATRRGCFVTASNFESLGLAAPLLHAVTQLGFTAPTSVQEQAIPAALKGGDWMVSSQTGSGKTAAFLLPMLHRLLNAGAAEQTRVATPRAVVLCPTRELAQQVTADAIDLMRGVGEALRAEAKQHPLRDAARGLRIATVVGGMPFGKQLFDLRGAQLVVATPGRLLDLHSRGQIRLDATQVLVVDEADRMLDLGFAEDLAAIADATAQRDQTMMFSATFAPRIMALASKLMRSPGRLELATRTRRAQRHHPDAALGRQHGPQASAAGALAARCRGGSGRGVRQHPGRHRSHRRGAAAARPLGRRAARRDAAGRAQPPPAERA